MIKWPKMLLKGLAYDNLTILFGAGIPYEFDFPLWDKLVDLIFEEIKSELNSSETLEIQEYIKAKDYLNVIEILSHKNQEEVIDFINNQFYKDDFDREKVENSNEKLLFDLNANVYLTTNVDNSLEEVKGLAGKKAANIYSYKNDNDIRDKLISHNSEKDPLIVRLHGELKEYSSLIFTQSQYSKLNKKDLFVFKQLLPSLFLVTTVLIIGYSISDPDIQLILEKTTKIKGKRNNIFFINVDPNLSEHKKRMFRMRFGIYVIDIPQTEDDMTLELKNILTQMVEIKKKLCEYTLSEKRELFKKGDSTISRELKKALGTDCQ